MIHRCLSPKTRSFKIINHLPWFHRPWFRFGQKLVNLCDSWLFNTVERFTYSFFIETKRWVPDLHVFESSRRLHQVFHVLINRERRWSNSSSVGTNDGMRCRQGIVLRQLSRIWQTCYLCLEGFKHQLVEEKNNKKTYQVHFWNLFSFKSFTDLSPLIFFR